jgi:hypothetical protein
MAWDHFNALINTGPDLAIQDPILLQYFYMGLDRKPRSILTQPQEARSFMFLPIQGEAFVDRSYRSSQTVNLT